MGWFVTNRSLSFCLCLKTLNLGSKNSTKAVLRSLNNSLDSHSKQFRLHCIRNLLSQICTSVSLHTCTGGLCVLPVRQVPRDITQETSTVRSLRRTQASLHTIVLSTPGNVGSWSRDDHFSHQMFLTNKGTSVH